RAMAADTAKVDYAVSDDPGGGSTNWGQRGSLNYALPTTKVSTVGVNVQSNAALQADITGEVKINFASETVPLDRFADEARRTLLERRARPKSTNPTQTSGGATASPSPVSPATVAPATPAPPAEPQR